jgi:hypothetical protein
VCDHFTAGSGVIRASQCDINLSLAVPANSPCGPQPRHCVGGFDRAYSVPPSRQARKVVTTWQDEITLKQLKQLSAETDQSQQALLAEALVLLFAEYGKPPIAS